MRIELTFCIKAGYVSIKIMTITRRNFLAQSAALTLGATVPALAQPEKPPRILLRSSWQVFNIGDIAHTPGVLALLEKYIPEAEVRLWASPDLSEEVMAMEHRRFPKLQIVKGTIDAQGKARIRRCKMRSIGATFCCTVPALRWLRQRMSPRSSNTSRKPFGVYGITHGSCQSGANEKELLSQARFVFFRDSPSLKLAQSEGVKAPVMGFAPDGAFACDLRDDAKAKAFLRAQSIAGWTVSLLSRAVTLHAVLEISQSARQR